MWTQQELDQYVWFHYMEFENNTFTKGWKDNKHLFDWIVLSLNKFDLKEKKVSDVGCRDGLLSFEIEKKGAVEIVSIDNNMSIGAKNLLIPRLQSKINMIELSIYDLNYSEYFDYTFCYGVLYHLRYPFLGLKKLVDATKINGDIIIETGTVINEDLEKYSICGSTSRHNSPYEGSSCIFFNKKGLIDTMSTFECSLNWYEYYNRPQTSTSSNFVVDRCIFSFKKNNKYQCDYWDGIHRYHTTDGFFKQK